MVAYAAVILLVLLTGWLDQKIYVVLRDGSDCLEGLLGLW
jgi:hypothetical protein